MKSKQEKEVSKMINKHEERLVTLLPGGYEGAKEGERVCERRAGCV